MMTCPRCGQSYSGPVCARCVEPRPAAATSLPVITLATVTDRFIRAGLPFDEAQLRADRFMDRLRRISLQSAALRGAR